MDFYDLPDYKKFAEAINKSRKNKFNLQIVTLPGTGATFYLKRYFEKEKSKDLVLITEEGQKLSTYNLVLADVALKHESIGWIENYLRMASVEQKFCVLINDLTQEGAYLKQHTYEKFYFGSQDKESMKNMADFLEVKSSEKQIKEVLNFSGGFGQLAKYMFTHPNIDEEEVKILMEETNKVVQKLDKVEWDKFYIQGDYWQNFIFKDKLDISVGSDLVVIENGQTGRQLTLVEVNIIKKLLGSNGTIKKDEVSEIKWPGTSFDSFSEQAINKTMRRLSYQLKFYEIKAIPKYGYKIVAK